MTNWKENCALGRTSVCSELEAAVKEHEAYLTMRLKIEAVFEHYAAQAEYYKQANVAQRFEMKDSFYRLSMELLARISLASVRDRTDAAAAR